MATTSYGKITIIDVTDVGNYSVYPYANGPNTQIYSEETGNYYPDWTTGSHLVLTPVITYAGQDKTADSTVNWYLKTDLEHPITTGFNSTTKQLTISTNIPVNNTYIVYVVKASYHTETGADVNAEGEITFNLLTQTSSVKNVSISGVNVIKYGRDSSTPVPAQTELTAKLIGGSHITGEGWKYWDGSDWSTNYINGSSIAGLVANGLTLTVNASYNNTAAYFTTDIARFKYVAHATDTPTDKYEDIFTVTQLRDGASGDALVTMDLTNDDQLVPINKSGVAQWSAIGDLASTTVSVYRGSDNITTENSITATLSNVTVELYNGSTKYTSSWSSGSALPTNYYKVKVTGFTGGATSGSVTFSTTVYSYLESQDNSVQSGTTYYSKNSSTGVYSVVSSPTGSPKAQGWYTRGNGLNYSKTFSLIGQEAGTDGNTPVIYTLDFPNGIPAYVNTPTGSAAAQTLQDNWGYSPTNLTIKAYKIVTDQNGVSTRTAYVENGNGARVWYRPNIVNGTPAVDGSNNQTWGSLDLNSSGEGTLVAADKLLAAYSPYTFRLVGPSESIDATNIKDEESINIVTDGKIGNAGNNGEDALNLLINNENVTLNATVSGATRAQTITVGYQGYIGTEEDSHFALAASPNHFSSSKNGLVASVTDNAAHNQVTITLNSGVSVVKGETGTITLNFVYSGVTPNITVSKIISWDAKLDAKDGEDAVILTFTYSGDKTTYFKNETGQTKVTPVLLQNGSNILDNTYTVVWKDLITNNTLSGGDIENSITAVIDASDISGVGSYSCTVSKSGKSYVQYVSFTDYSDPLQVELISTIGDKLTNGIGEGVVYPQTTRDGSVLDQISNNSIVVWGSASAPSNPADGDYYLKTSDNKLYQYSSGSWVARTNYAEIIVLRSESSINPIELRTLSGSTYPTPSASSFSDLTYVWSFRDVNGNVINPSSLTELKVSYVNSTTAPTSTTTQVTGGQFIYINKNVINNKIVILCQVTKN